MTKVELIYKSPCYYEINYNAESGDLLIEFHGGVIYVPIAEADEFAKSIQNAVNKIQLGIR